jgi:aspartate/methionine/tyrosine aminotransferase
MSHSSLVSTISKAKEAGTPIKALVIINPGNPTGGCLAYDAMKDVVQLCYDEGILLMADEVYQANIFQPDTKPFVSFKKVVRDMPKEVAEGTQLVSFHSISKGNSGECGRRGGYFELVNIAEEVQEQVYKMASIGLCPPVTGQVRRFSHCLNGRVDTSTECVEGRGRHGECGGGGVCGDRLGKRVSVVESISEVVCEGMLCGLPSPYYRAHTVCDYSA